MPILAALLASETSLKIGSLAGNVPPMVTAEATPLTETFAVAAGAAAGADRRSALGSGRRSATRADGLPESDVGCEAPASGAFSACCANGSLLSKRSKVINVPSVAVGAGSESPSAAGPPPAVAVTAAGMAVPAAGAAAAAEGGGGGAGSVATSDEPPPKRPRIVGAW